MLNLSFKCLNYAIPLKNIPIFIVIKDYQMDPLGQGVIRAPDEVKPGHIMLAPLSTNLIAPLSTCCQGKM